LAWPSPLHRPGDPSGRRSRPGSPAAPGLAGLRRPTPGPRGSPALQGKSDATTPARCASASSSG